MWDRRDLEEARARPAMPPMAGLPLEGFGEAFAPALESFRALDQSVSERRMLAEAAERYLAPYRQATGHDLANPMWPAWGGYGTDARVETDQGGAWLTLGEQIGSDGERANWELVAGAYRKARHQHPELPELPELDAMQEEARALARSRAAAGEDAASRTFGLWANAGRTLGVMTGAVTDPVNAATLGLGAARGAGWLAGTLTEAGVGAGTELLLQPGVQAWRRKVGVESGFAQGAANVAAGALGGAGFYLGLRGSAAAVRGGWKGTAAAWRAFRAANPTRRLSPREREAEAALDAAEGYLDRSPARPGSDPAEAEIAHAEALGEAERALAQGRAPGGPALQRAAELAAIGRDTGQDGAVWTPAGRRVEVRYELIDVRRLTASHSDDVSAENPDYPQLLQPRDRSKAVSGTQVAQIAAQLQPERLAPGPNAGDGPPIIGPGGIVESGNGRVLAIRRAYDLGPQGERYRAWLEAQGYDVAGIERPALIARRATPMSDAELVRFVAEPNAPTTLRMSTAEQAAADARHIPDSVLELFRPGAFGSAANREFVRAVAGSLPSTERGVMAADPGLSLEGVRRLQGIALAKAFDDPKLLTTILEHPDSDVKAIAGALLEIAPRWAKLRAGVRSGRLSPDMDLTGQLVAAVGLVRHARQEGRPVAELLDQHGLFGDVDPITDQLVRLFYGDASMTRGAGRERIIERLTRWLDEAERAGQAGALRGLELDAPTPERILGTITESLARERPVDLDAAGATAREIEAALDATGDPAEAAARQLAAGKVPGESVDRIAATLASGTRTAGELPETAELADLFDRFGRLEGISTVAEALGRTADVRTAARQLIASPAAARLFDAAGEAERAAIVDRASRLLDQPAAMDRSAAAIADEFAILRQVAGGRGRAAEPDPDQFGLFEAPAAAERAEGPPSDQPTRDLFGELDESTEPTPGRDAPEDFTVAEGAPRQPWAADSGDLVVQGGKQVADHPDHPAAKAGDAAAADRLVRDLVTDAKVDELRRIVGDSDAVLVPVRALELEGRNRIPAAFADALARRLGLRVAGDIVQVNRAGHTNARAARRIVARSSFAGPVEPGRAYVLAEDHVTLGGTLADLKAYIESRGGRVIAATSLSKHNATRQLALSPEALAAVRAKLGADAETWFRERLGYGFDRLTDAEARYLSKFKGGDSLRRRLAQEHAGRHDPGGGGRAAPQGERSAPPVSDPGGGGPGASRSGGGPRGGAPGEGSAGGERADPAGAEPAVGTGRELDVDPAPAEPDAELFARAFADPELQIPVDVGLAADGTTRTVYRSARELLEDSDAEQRTAAELAACSLALFGKAGGRG